ncbi:hypothetical protein [Niabella drilacis]|uniref:hypothetical protein n=1 Tax=Niabella drilacis (strain DSM 25811 / CCM 8410 / CCUG 62505 / LMG 26954 / E90) TaxID=1285928 RepID=UPI00115FDE78|nr:hypothetical protein [Niabella drilacis]
MFQHIIWLKNKKIRQDYFLPYFNWRFYGRVESGFGGIGSVSPLVESGGVSGPSACTPIITVPLPSVVVVWGWLGHKARKKAMIISIMVLFLKCLVNAAAGYGAAI